MWTLSNYVKMTTNLTAELLEKIKITEKEKDRHKILRTQPIIKTTNEIASSKRHKRKLIPNPLIIKRNLKLDIILSLVLCTAISSPFIYFIVNDKSGNTIGNTFAAIIVLGVFFALLGNLTFKKLILPIVFSHTQIEIIGEIFEWNSIENTFFVIRPNSSSSFVIGLKNGELKYFNIGNQLGFKYSERDFSEFVEYFKNTAPNMRFCAIGG
jgi:hypothetical protein